MPTGRFGQGRDMATASTEPALTGLDERRVLAGWLDHHRATLLRKVDGLTDAQALARSAPPSSLNLLGLVRHMADNEVWWFQAVLAGRDVAAADWPSAAQPGDPEDPDADLDPPPTATLAVAVPLFTAACARSREVLDDIASLDVEADLRGEPVSARWVATHMVEEYARQNGHADLLREAIDGATGA